MSSARIFRLSFSILVVAQLATAVASVFVLQHMSPAIDEVVYENVRSIAAVQSMTAALASSPELPGRRDAFEAAMAQAEANVTEPDEVEELEAVRGAYLQALEGRALAQRETLEALEVLNEINEEAMLEADVEAKRLGTAGAWGVTLFTLLALTASLVAWRRTRNRVLEPLREVEAVLAAHERGDSQRRCITGGLRSDLTEAMVTLNELFDERERSTRRRAPRSRADGAEWLGRLLDYVGRPAVLADQDGAFVACSDSALEALGGDGGRALREAINGAAGRALAAAKAEASEDEGGESADEDEVSKDEGGKSEDEASETAPVAEAAERPPKAQGRVEVLSTTDELALVAFDDV